MISKEEFIERFIAYCELEDDYDQSQAKKDAEDEWEWLQQVTTKLTVEQALEQMNPRQSIQDQVIEDLEHRKQLGLSTYGTLLYPHNGRDQLQDAYEEALDLACYLKSAMIERDDYEG